jgi:hypothetical protein
MPGDAVGERRGSPARTGSAGVGSRLRARGWRGRGRRRGHGADHQAVPARRRAQPRPRSRPRLTASGSRTRSASPRSIWLDRGLVNDHTDGHIDTLARFVAPGVVVAHGARPADDPNRERARRDPRRPARGPRTPDGRALEVVTVPSPGTVTRTRPARCMPASYMNFYIGNTTVVVPTYRRRQRRGGGRGRSRSLFPGRRTVGVDCNPMVVGGGGFHCTHPAAARARCGREHRDRRTVAALQLRADRRRRHQRGAGDRARPRRRRAGRADHPAARAVRGALLLPAAAARRTS